MTLNVREHQPKAASLEAVRQENKARLALLYEVGQKVSSVSQMSDLLERVLLMTQRTLNASASSVLLFNDKEQRLSFKVAIGPAGKALRRASLNTQGGIAGWVARNGKPLIINDVTRDQRFNSTIDKTTGFVTRSIICAPMLLHRQCVGVIEVLNKLDGSDFTEQDLETLMTVASTAAISIENAKLQKNLLDAYKSTIKSLAAAIDAKDPYTCGHSQRVMEYALLAGKNLSLAEEDLETIEYAGILHDIGKIAISDGILNKAASLTPKEWSIMREHPLIGARILKEIPFLEKATDLVLHHHERFDGTGYPHGLKGNDIPLGARLLAVADAFDTMTTNRSYRAALPIDYSISELHCCAVTQFCPTAVEAFIAGLDMNTKRLSHSPTLMTGQPVRECSDEEYEITNVIKKSNKETYEDTHSGGTQL